MIARAVVITWERGLWIALSGVLWLIGRRGGFKDGVHIGRNQILKMVFPNGVPEDHNDVGGP